MEGAFSLVKTHPAAQAAGAAILEPVRNPAGTTAGVGAKARVVAGLGQFGFLCWVCGVRHWARRHSRAQLHAKAKGHKGSKGNRGGGNVKKKIVIPPFPSYAPDEVHSLDVECVATGTTHEKSDREPCSLALVDGFGKAVYQTLIQPARPVVSYLTPFTGLRHGDLDGSRAISLQRAIGELKRHLPKSSVLVGQDPQGDADWMQLTKGVDFVGLVNLAEVFRNERDMRFSLRHEARVLLGKVADLRTHDPCWDARMSVELYRIAADATPKELSAMREKLTSKKFWPPLPSLARECGYEIDGVCLSMYNKDNCSCGKPLATH